MATLTFVYSDSTAVVGPLATAREPHSWDLCVSHAGRITAPRGWELMRHAGPLDSEPTHPDDDDLVALADAVREGRAVAGGSSLPVAPRNGFHVRAEEGYDGYEDVPRGGGVATATAPSSGVLAPPEHRSGRRRGHLRVLPDLGE